MTAPSSREGLRLALELNDLVDQRRQVTAHLFQEQGRWHNNFGGREVVALNMTHRRCFPCRYLTEIIKMLMNP